MRNTRKSGQRLRSKKRPHPTLRSGRGSRTNSNTSYQIQARVIEADSPSAVVYGGGLTRFACSLLCEAARRLPTSKLLQCAGRKTNMVAVKILDSYRSFRPTIPGTADE